MSEISLKDVSYDIVYTNNITEPSSFFTDEAVGRPYGSYPSALYIKLDKEYSLNKFIIKPYNGTGWGVTNFEISGILDFNTPFVFEDMENIVSDESLFLKNDDIYLDDSVVYTYDISSNKKYNIYKINFLNYKWQIYYIDLIFNNITNKYLIKNNNDVYYSLDTNNDVIEITDSLSKEVFENQGISELSSDNINYVNSSSLIDNNYKILTYFDNEISKQMVFNINNKTKKIYSTDIDLNACHEINTFTLNGTSTNNTLKILFSNDSGNTYFYYDFDLNEFIPMSIENIKTYGMTLTEFNSINENFNNSFFIEDNKKIKFCFYYDDNNDLLDSISYDIDLNGRWDTIISGSESTICKMSYITNKNLKINLLSPGTYKINY